MARPRIKSVEQRLVEKYRALGLSSKEAWAKIKEVEFRSDMRFATL